MHPGILCGRDTQRMLTALLVIATLTSRASWTRGSDTFEPIEKTLNWLGDYGEALKASVEAKRPVWVQFTGPWCPNCHKMDRETFKNPRVIERLSKHFVTAKISCEENADLAISFGFTQLPSSVLISPDGKILARHEGFADPEKLESLTVLAGVPADTTNRDTQIAGTDDKGTIEADLVSKPMRAEHEVIEIAMLEPVSDDLPRISVRSDEPPVTEASELLTSKEPVETPVKDKAVTVTEGQQPTPLGHYCPVALLDKAVLVEVDSANTAVYAGSRYFFENAEAKARFAAEPEKFVPARGGECLVTLVETSQEKAGSEKFPVVYDGRIYLCVSEEARQKFLAEPATFANLDLRSQGTCPHCGATLASHSQGRGRFQIRFGGSRYQFPDKAHMEAFLKAPLRYLR
jgi:YHS domain-containing protein/thioredoxin-related protein